MPVYDWTCSQCDWSFEEMLPMSESNKYNDTQCKKCGIGTMNRILHCNGIQVPMRGHEIKSRQIGHKQRIADKVKTIKDKKNKGTL